MLIVCQNCATSYQVEDSSIGECGRSVRCARCRKVWFASSPKPPGEPEEAAFRTELGAEVTTADYACEPLALQEPPPETEPAAPTESASEPPPEQLISAVEPDVGEAAEKLEGESEPADLPDIPTPADHAPEPVAGYSSSVIDQKAADIESVARRRSALSRPARPAKSRVRVPFAIGALAVVCATLLGLRKEVVRQLPQLASFYAAVGMPVNLRGLALADLKLGRETNDGVPVLAVEGIIVNSVSKPVEVPRLRFALRNAAGAEVYTWTAMPAQTVLDPGESLPFRSRIASPPDDGRDVQVRFFTRRDALAGLR